MTVEFDNKNQEYREFCAILNKSPSRNRLLMQEDCLLIVRQFVEGKIRAQKAVKRYNIGNENNLYRWLGRYTEA